MELTIPAGSFVDPRKLLKAWNKRQKATSKPVIKQTTALEEEALQLASKHSEAVLRTAMSFRAQYERVEFLAKQEVKNVEG